MTSELERGEWSASRSGHFTPGERARVKENIWAKERGSNMWLGETG